MSVYERVLDLAPRSPRGDERARSSLHRRRDVGSPRLALRRTALGRRRPSGPGGRGHPPGRDGQLAHARQARGGRSPISSASGSSSPVTPGMVSFFREWCLEHSEQARLAQILTDAQRAMPDGPERGKLAAEIAGLAEEGANAQKAIEQWRTLLRSEPTNVAARDALKRLYRQTGSFNHLADLLRSELERIAPDDAAARLPGAPRHRADLPRAHQERLRARHPCSRRSSASTRPTPTPCASSHASMRPSAAGAICSPRRAPRRARDHLHHEGRALSRDCAPLARSVLQRAERGRGLREAPRSRARRPRGGLEAEGALHEAPRLPAAVRDPRRRGEAR